MKTPNADIIITNTLPPQQVLLTVAILDERDTLLARAESTDTIPDIAAYIVAQELYLQLTGFVAKVHDARMEITRKIDLYKKQYQDAEELANSILHQPIADLSSKIAVFGRWQKQLQDEADKKARDEALAQAAELRQQQDAARKVELATWQTAQDQRKKDVEDEIRRFGVAVDMEPLIPPPPTRIMPIIPIIAAPMQSLPVMPRSVVRVSHIKTTVIFDRALLIAEACKTGGMIAGKLVLMIDENAVKEMVNVGVPVPGARSETKERIGKAGCR